MSMNTTWLGISPGAGIALIAGVSVNYVHMFNMSQPSLTMKCGVTGSRLGVVAHVGGSISLAIMTGVNTRSDVRGLTDSGFDFAVDFGAKWGAMVKASGWAAKGLKALSTVSDLPMLKMWAASEAGKGFVNFLIGDLSLSHQKPSFAMVGTPAGIGLGAGIWYEWQNIQALGGPDAWDFFKPHWRIVKHNGAHWLQLVGAPVEDDTVAIVSFREEVYGFDNRIEVQEPFMGKWSSVNSGTIHDQQLYETKWKNVNGDAAPLGGGLNLTWRNLRGRRTRKGVQALGGHKTFGLGINVAVNSKRVWECDDYIKVTTDSRGDFGHINNVGNKFLR